MKLSRLFSLLIVLSLLAPAFADRKIVEKRRTEASELMGHTEPAQEQTVTIWLGKDRLRTDLAKKSMLIREDQKKFYIIQPELRRYAVTDLPLNMRTIVSDAMWKMVEPMLENMKISLTVTPTDEHKEIAGFSCRRYELEMSSATMKVHSTVWASPEIPVSPEAVRMLTTAMFVTQKDQQQLLAQMQKIEGYRVYQETETEMMGSTIKTIEELISVEELTPPAQIYDPPAEFESVPLTLEGMSSP